MLIGNDAGFINPAYGLIYCIGKAMMLGLSTQPGLYIVSVVGAESISAPLLFTIMLLLIVFTLSQHRP
jgi:hypothetical protein